MKGGGASRLASVWIEMKCPEHGLERYKIKVVKKFNMKADIITPKFRSRPRPDVSGFSLLVGRDVSNREIEKFLSNYFQEKGLFEAILRMKFI